MKFVCYTDWNQLPESANALFTQAEQGNLFYSRAWLENVSHSLDADQTIVLACVIDNTSSKDNVLAILPLVKCNGNNFVSLKHRYTTHYSLLIADPDQNQALDCLVQGLVTLPLDSVLLEPVDENDKRISGLQRALETAGFSSERFFRFYNWIYHVQGQTFNEYMTARPGQLRNTISRKQRKLKREHGYEIRIYTGVEVLQAMPDYYSAYNASWKANEQYVSFLDSVVAGFSNAGWSRLGVLYISGRAIAAQLWFVVHGKASIFRLAYDEDWKQYSPGSILTYYLMEYVIDIDKVVEIDFLTGNEAYKQDWMSERRQRFALSCIKRVKSAGKFEHFIALLKRLMKKT